MTNWIVDFAFELIASGVTGLLGWLAYRHFRRTAFASPSSIGGEYKPSLSGWFAALLGPPLSVAITASLFGLAAAMIFLEGELFGRLAGFAFFLGGSAYFAWNTVKSFKSSHALLFRSLTQEGDAIVTRSWLGVARYPLGAATGVLERDEDFEFTFLDGRVLIVPKLITGSGNLANEVARRTGMEPLA